MPATPDPLVRNCVRVVGKPDAPQTLVFVHGFGTDQTVWEPVAAPFLATHRVVLLDQVGFGRTREADFVQHRYLSLRAYAEDLNEVCAALRLRGAIAVGHSAGAMVGVLAALARPEHFSRLVLLGASPRYLDEPGYHGGFTKEDLNELYRAISSDYEVWADRFAQLAMDNPDRPRLAEHFGMTLRSLPPDRALTVLCSIFQSDYRADVARLAHPTLLVQSTQDFAVPREVSEYLRAKIRDCRLVQIDAKGHLPHVSDPAAVVAALEPFVRESEAFA